jgi:DNA-binding beta-propeller fold protein YncE
MIVDKKNELVVNDPGYDKINVYGLNPLRGEAAFRYGLSPYGGQIFGIGLDKSNKFLWAANAVAAQGQQYSFTSGGTEGTTATDPTLVQPMGAAARPSSAE